jgi:hypothetical protein
MNEQVTLTDLQAGFNFDEPGALNSGTMAVTAMASLVERLLADLRVDPAAGDNYAIRSAMRRCRHNHPKEMLLIVAYLYMLVQL